MIRKVILRFIKAIIYSIFFALQFILITELGVPEFLAVAILLGVIAAIANEHREYSSVWDTETVYVVVCAYFEKNNPSSLPSLSYQFASTHQEAKAIIKSDVEEHIKRLHKPIACSNDLSTVAMTDEHGGRWQWWLQKKYIRTSKTQDF